MKRDGDSGGDGGAGRGDLVAHFERVRRASPDRVAVSARRRLTYAALDAIAERSPRGCARRRGRRCASGFASAIPAVAVGVLGILKSGGAYSPWIRSTRPKRLR